MKNQLIINNKEVELSPESWKNMEEQFKRESFYPEQEEDFFLISFEEAVVEIFNENYDNGYKSDFDCGIAFKTRPEAEAKLAEMKAITKVRKFIFEEGLSFEPDWSNRKQDKWSFCYNHYFVVLTKEGRSFFENHSPFGHLKSEEDCEKVIENCKDELDVIFKVKK